MRPLHLTVAGIGPFANQVEVPLDDLMSDGLFLIHGPTGAGKTSLLDAMTFALYGSVPGARGSDGKDQFRSHHADAHQESFVEFHFALHGDRFLARRSPSYERPKRRGHGTTHQAATAHLHRAEGNEWKELAVGGDEVRREVERLLGLNDSQFAQVIVLPQGKFQQVLQATSSEREQLLSTLFDTDLFSAVERWIADAAQQSQAALLDIDHQLERLRSSAAERWNALSDAPTPVPADQRELDELCRLATDSAERSEQAAATARSSRDQAQDDLLVARTAAELWDRRASLERRSAELAVVAPEIEALADRLAAAQRAQASAGALHQFDAAVADLAAAERRATDRWARFDSVVAATTARLPDLHLPSLRSADIASAGSAAADTELRSVLQTARADLERVAELQVRLDASTTALAAAQADVDRQERQCDQSRRAAEDALSALHHCERQVQDAVTSAARLDAAAQHAERLQELLQAHDDLQLVQDDLRDAHDAHRTAIDAHQSARDAQLSAQQTRFEHFAALLADRLVDGEPCSVCGAHDHPQPAPPSPLLISDDRFELLNQELEAAAQERTHCSETLARLIERQASLTSRTADAPDRSVLAQQARDAKAALEAARRAADQVVPLERERETAAQHHERVAAAAATDVSEHARLVAAQSAAGALADQAGRELDALVGSEPVDAAAAMRALDELDRLARRATEQQQSLRLASAHLDAARSRLDQELASSGCASVELLRDALLDAAERAQLASRIDRHRTDTASVREQLEEPALASAPAERPDLEAAHGAAAESAQAHDELARRAARRRDAADAIAVWREQHGTLSQDCGPLRKRAELTSRVAQAVCGQAGQRVSLSRWVLAAYLQDICTIANHRLASMTSGRYQLRVNEAGGRSNRRGGLDLMVHDTHTGQDRKVSTLSGGETFQASLALALAVADAVQQHSGGVRLDALFIDEGFGSLDPDVLELAMDELDQLRTGGRSVGVISHVAALRERIHTGIEVVSSEVGSTVRVGGVSTS